MSSSISTHSTRSVWLLHDGIGGHHWQFFETEADAEKMHQFYRWGAQMVIQKIQVDVVDDGKEAVKP